VATQQRVAKTPRRRRRGGITQEGNLENPRVGKKKEGHPRRGDNRDIARAVLAYENLLSLVYDELVINRPWIPSSRRIIIRLLMRKQSFQNFVELI